MEKYFNDGLYTANFAVVKKMFTLEGEINSFYDLKNTIDDRLYYKIDTNMN